MTEQRYVIENVGGVARAELTLQPGVNVLSGENGVGKTSSMHAILRSHGAEIPVRRRDGTERGLVTGPGNLRLVVGDVARRTGRAELGLVDTAPLDALIDPGFVDDDANARAQIRSLVTLLGLGATDEHLARLVAHDPLRDSSGEKLGDWLRQELNDRAEGDLFIAGELLKGECQRRARHHEQIAEQAEGRRDAALERADRETAALGGRMLSELAEDAARDQLVLAGREYEKRAAAAHARAKLEGQQAEIKATLGERPNPDAIQIEIRAHESELREIEAGIAALEAQRGGLLVAISARRSRHAEALLEANRWDAAQAILAKPAEGPLEAELPAIHDRLVGIAEARLKDAMRSAEVRRSKQEALDADLVRLESGANGARLRELAAHVPTALGEILASAGAAGITVDKGRLAVRDGDQIIPWAQLSDGQRTRRALEIGLAVYPENAVIPIGPATWAHLDPENRALVGRLSAERGRFILTEAPTDGALRVEHLG